MHLEKCLLRKWKAKSSFFLIGPYCTYTGPHLPILFPMWPASQKELPTPAVERFTDLDKCSRWFGFRLEPKFTIIPAASQMVLDSKVVKINPKIIFVTKLCTIH